jgi:hypothetical protein
VKRSNKFGGLPVCEDCVSAGNPRGRPLIFSAVGDLAFFAVGQELENNLFAAVQAGPSVILGCREDQPVSSQNFIRTVNGKDLIAAIGIHFQRWSRAALSLSVDLDADAVISSGEVGLRARRGAAQNQDPSADDEKFNEDVK